MKGLIIWKENVIGPDFSYKNFQLGIPTCLVKKILIILAEQNCLKEAVHLSSSCKRFRNIYSSPSLWQAFFARLPQLQSYAFSGRYYELCRDHYIAKQNVRKGKYQILGPMDFSWDTSRDGNVLYFRDFVKETVKVINLFLTPEYEVDNKVFYLGDEEDRFIFENSGDFKALHLMTGQIQCLPWEKDIGKNRSSINSLALDGPSIEIEKLTLNIPTHRMIDENHAATFIKEGSSIDAHIWDLEKGECISKIEKMVDTSLHQTVSIYFNKGIYLISKGAENFHRITFYDIKYNKKHEYRSDLIKVGEYALLHPYVGDEYLAFCPSEENLITFVERCSGRKGFVDLGELSKNLLAIRNLGRTRYVFDLPKFCEKEGIFSHWDKDNNVICLWNLKSKAKHEYSLGDEPVDIQCIEDGMVVIGKESRSLRILEQRSLEVLYQCSKEEHSFCYGNCFNSKIVFLQKPDNGPVIIYNIRLKRLVTLETESGVSYNFFRGKIWENFVAVLSEIEDRSQVSIFDVDSGKRVVDIPLSFPPGDDNFINWLNGALVVTEGETDDTYVINFNRNPISL